VKISRRQKIGAKTKNELDENGDSPLVVISAERLHRLLDERMDQEIERED